MMRTPLLITVIMCVAGPLALAENRPKRHPVESDVKHDVASLKKLILDDSNDSLRSQLVNTETKPNQLAADIPAREYVRSTAVHSIDLDISSSAGGLPENVAASAFADQGTVEHHVGFFRDDSQFITSQTQYQRVAPWIAYNPLYFDDPRLERDGYHFGCFEPVVSAAKFYGRIPLWPYMAGATHPHDCVYSLGQGRPGDCRPYYGTMPKRSVRGAAYQAAAVTSGVLLLP